MSWRLYEGKIRLRRRVFLGGFPSSHNSPNEFIMLSQEQFVSACNRYYERKGLEPGNPFHGGWERAHYPIPNRLGGKKCVWLLKHHHAIHGVIQSEELGLCCVAWWEEDLLPSFYLPYYQKWRHQHQVDNSGKFWEKMSEEERKAVIQKMVRGQKRTPEYIAEKTRILLEMKSDPTFETLRVSKLVERVGKVVEVIEGDQKRVYPSVRQASVEFKITHKHLNHLLSRSEEVTREGKTIRVVRKTESPTL